MLTIELEKEILEKLELANEGKLNVKGRGYARRVYDFDENYVIKVESLLYLSDSKLYTYHRQDLVRIRKVLIAYSDNPTITLEKKVKRRLDEELERMNRFLDYLGLEFNRSSIEIYISFLFGDSHLQNIPEYLNYLELKDTELGNYITTSLGILFTEHYSVTIQEKGQCTRERTIEGDNKVQDFFRAKIRPSFRKAGYSLEDMSDENLVICKDGTIKICDTGCCILNIFGINNYW